MLGRCPNTELLPYPSNFIYLFISFFFKCVKIHQVLSFLKIMFIYVFPKFYTSTITCRKVTFLCPLLTDNFASSSDVTQVFWLLLLLPHCWGLVSVIVYDVSMSVSYLKLSRSSLNLQDKPQTQPDQSLVRYAILSLAALFVISLCQGWGSTDTQLYHATLSSLRHSP